MKKVIIIFILLGCSLAHAQETMSEDAIKAAFIYHFIGFTQWHDQEAEYDVCIPDDDTFRGVVMQSLDGKVIGGRTIRVVSRYDHCHVLVTETVAPEPEVFTIGSLANGALLEFRVVDNKLRFAISMPQLKRSKLKISSQLLKLAIMENQQ